jgi:hypothetical protein
LVVIVGIANLLPSKSSESFRPEQAIYLQQPAKINRRVARRQRLTPKSTKSPSTMEDTLPEVTQQHVTFTWKVEHPPELRTKLGAASFAVCAKGARFCAH